MVRLKRIFELMRLTHTKTLGRRVRWLDADDIQRKGMVWYERKKRFLWGAPMVIVWCTDGVTRIVEKNKVI